MPKQRKRCLDDSFLLTYCFYLIVYKTEQRKQKQEKSINKFPEENTKRHTSCSYTQVTPT
jgi:hypothetical protein